MRLNLANRKLWTQWDMSRLDTMGQKLWCGHNGTRTKWNSADIMCHNERCVWQLCERLYRFTYITYF